MDLDLRFEFFQIFKSLDIVDSKTIFLVCSLFLILLFIQVTLFKPDMMKYLLLRYLKVADYPLI